jgi:hypothetical protein
MNRWPSAVTINLWPYALRFANDVYNKRGYPNGKTHSLLVIDKKLVEKRMTFGWEGILKKSRKRKKKG